MLSKTVHGCRRWLGGVILTFLMASLLTAQVPPANKKGDEPDKVPGKPLQLPDNLPEKSEPLHFPREKPTHTLALARYRQVALQLQPAIVAARTNLCIAQAKVESLAKIGGIANLVRKDLEVRREQAQQGLIAAQAQLSVAAWEALYGVTRNYWSATFAQEQLNLAEQALDPEKVGSLRWLRKLINEIYQEAGRKDLREWSVTNIDVLIEAVQARKIEAEIGMKRATAAMREAMGVGCDYPIHIPTDAQLPWIDISLCRADVLKATQERRGEITQAAIFKEVSTLEIQAQAKMHPWSLQGETFAAGSDIHVLSVPMQLENGEYRPGAVGPDMPGKLAGHRDDRVNQATLYAERACSVVEKTRQLLNLQAEDAYWKFEKATREIEANRKVVKVAEKAKNMIIEEFKPVAPLGAHPNLDDLLLAALKSALFQFSLNQARYERLLALTLLERVTAGGVNPGFDGPLPLEDATLKKKGDEKDLEEKKPNGEKKNDEKKPPEQEVFRGSSDAVLSQRQPQVVTGGKGN
jgi:hypothetical protein